MSAPSGAGAAPRRINPKLLIVAGAAALLLASAAAAMWWLWPQAPQGRQAPRAKAARHVALAASAALPASAAASAAAEVETAVAAVAEPAHVAAAPDEAPMDRLQRRLGEVLGATVEPGQPGELRLRLLKPSH